MSVDRVISQARLLGILLVLALGVSLFAAQQAAAVSTNCSVNASGGYANCLSKWHPTVEVVKGWHTAGLPYRFKLHNFANGGSWGYWQFYDLNYHGVGLGLLGTITAQVDNMGSANPASYYVSLQ